MNQINTGKFPRSGVLVVGSVFIFIIFLIKTAITIDSGEAGVLYKRFSGGVDIENVMDEGFHIVAPWNKVYIYEVRQQEIFERMEVLSSNGLEIALDISAWYQPEYANLGKLHQEKGDNYLNRIIKPAMRSATRSVVGRYTPEQTYSTKRDAIQEEIFMETKKILEKEYIRLNQTLVRDVTLPPSIKEAIERKLRQEQEALEYEFRIEKAKKEAERQKIDAEGKATANRILNASLSHNILREKGIEATIKLAESPNSKIVVIGNGKDGLPLILNSNN